MSPAQVQIHQFSTDRINNRVMFGASSTTGQSISLHTTVDPAAKGDGAKIALKAELAKFVTELEKAIDAA